VAWVALCGRNNRLDSLESVGIEDNASVTYTCEERPSYGHGDIFRERFPQGRRPFVEKAEPLDGSLLD